MRKQPRILVVDDQRDLLLLTQIHLEMHSYEVKIALSGTAALQILESFWPDLVISDIVMPGMDGIELAKRIKAISDIPIIFLSIVNDPDIRAETISRYAEDYITKPHTPQELYARVERVLRTSGPNLHTTAAIVIDENLTIDFGQATAQTPQGTIKLSTTETRILYLLVQHLGTPVPTELILKRIWRRATATPQTLATTIYHLRQKIEPQPKRPRHILTVRRIGYRFAHTRSDIPYLTDQHLKILRLIAQGYTDNKIAMLLSLSSRTISDHVREIRNALHANSRAHAVIIAVGLSILSPSGMLKQSPWSENDS